jgi:hypothetical protein
VATVTMAYASRRNAELGAVILAGVFLPSETDWQ